VLRPAGRPRHGGSLGPVSSIVSHPTPLTWDEFLALPYETRNAALIDGEVVVNPPNAQHEAIVRTLIVAFSDWERSGAGTGQVSTQQPVKVNDRRGYQPDFMWYPVERCAPAGEPPKFSGPPELVVEVLSPSTRTFDLIRKRGDYEQIGITEVWFVDPGDERVLVCARPAPGSGYVDHEPGPGDTLTSALLDRFALPVDELFRY
jgi:Uma2 family endonuclease